MEEKKPEEEEITTGVVENKEASNLSTDHIEGTERKLEGPEKALEEEEKDEELPAN